MQSYNFKLFNMCKFTHDRKTQKIIWALFSNVFIYLFLSQRKPNVFVSSTRVGVINKHLRCGRGVENFNGMKAPLILLTCKKNCDFF